MNRIQAKADERTPNVFRFALPISPGKIAALTIVTEHPQSSAITLFDADTDAIGVYAADTSISAAQRATLQSIIQQRRTIDTLRAGAQTRTLRVASFAADQERIRKNMQALDKASPLYKRYAGELALRRGTGRAGNANPAPARGSRPPVCKGRCRRQRPARQPGHADTVKEKPRPSGYGPLPYVNFPSPAL